MKKDPVPWPLCWPPPYRWGWWKSAPGGSRRGSGGGGDPRNESRPATAGPAATFTGDVSVKPLFDPNDSRNFSSAEVSFTPCADRLAHPSGRSDPDRQPRAPDGCRSGADSAGHCRRRCHLDRARREALARWEGDTAMTHIAIQWVVDGRPVDWMEHVTDDEYCQ